MAIAAAGGWEWRDAPRRTTRSAGRSSPLAALRGRRPGGRRAGRGLRPVAPRARRARSGRRVERGHRRGPARPSLDDGSVTITLGIGGSATTDGGRGILGARARVGDDRSTSTASIRLASVRLRIACDVSNPLLGPHGRRRDLRAAEGRHAGPGRRLDARTRRLRGRCSGARPGATSATRPAPGPPAGRRSGCCRSGIGSGRSRSCPASRS